MEIEEDEFPAWLRHIMGDMPQVQFARKIGITRATLWQLLNGHVGPGKDVRPKLAKFGFRGIRKVYLVDAE